MLAPSRARRTGVLAASFLHFDVSFLCWVMIGALGVAITKDLHLSASQKGFLVGVPILSGSVMRIVVGRVAEMWSIKKAGYITIAGAALGLVLGAMLARSYGALVGVGLLLGCSGASFAVALPLASRWFPPERQGIALGVAGAGNSGTVIATFFAPRIAAHLGWPRTMALALLPLLAMTLAWTLLAKDPRRQQAPSDVRSVLRDGDFWLLCFVYSVTFGGFVGLTTFLPLFLHGEYRLGAISAGNITAIAAFLGSAARPLGGFIADRVTGRVVAAAVLSVVAGCALVVGAHVSTAVTTAAVFVLLAALGAGNGAVFQMVPRRFPSEIAVVTGMVGAAGGIGGFYLPTMLGVLKDSTGTYLSGLCVYAGMATIAVLVVAVAGRRWTATWLAPLRTRAHQPVPAATRVSA